VNPWTGYRWLREAFLALRRNGLDVAADRAHATKRNRPIASDELSVRAAWTAAAILLPGALAISALLNWQMVLVVAIYEAVQLGYCLGMKHEPVIELTSVASGFLLRAIAGGVATAGKRYAEKRLFAVECGVIGVARRRRAAF